jgi:hypothetical protein
MPGPKIYCLRLHKGMLKIIDASIGRKNKSSFQVAVVSPISSLTKWEGDWFSVKQSVSCCSHEVANYRPRSLLFFSLQFSVWGPGPAHPFEQELITIFEKDEGQVLPPRCIREINKFGEASTWWMPRYIWLMPAQQTILK